MKGMWRGATTLTELYSVSCMLTNSQALDWEQSFAFG